MGKEMTFVRIYISEADPGRRGDLMEEIMQVLHDEHRVHGVTVFRGIAGFGSKGVVRAANLLRLSPHLPEVIEFFDEPGTVAAAIEAVQPLVPPGHLVSWRVRVI
jgi:PII-like signaling protein